jgi:hypothetical protein
LDQQDICPPQWPNPVTQSNLAVLQFQVGQGLFDGSLTSQLFEVEVVLFDLNLYNKIQAKVYLKPLLLRKQQKKINLQLQEEFFLLQLQCMSPAFGTIVAFFLGSKLDQKLEKMLL